MKHACVVSMMLMLASAHVSAQPPAPADRDPAPPSLPAVVPITPPRLALPLALRERRLALDLEVLGSRDSGRVTSGVIQVSVGAAFVTLGALLPSDVGRSLLLLFGAGTMAHGAFQLFLVEDAAALAKQYRELPQLTPQMAEQRVHFGERALATIARGARRARIANGTMAMTMSAAYVPLLWWLQQRDSPSYRFGDSAFDYVALTLSGINFASGLVTAIVNSEAERRLADYEALRARVTAARPAARSLSLQLGAVRMGASVGARLRF